MKRSKRRKTFQAAPIPTKEEIMQMAADIRSTWTAVTERHRRVQDNPPWTPPRTEVVIPNNSPPDWPAWPI